MQVPWRKLILNVARRLRVESNTDLFKVADAGRLKSARDFNHLSRKEEAAAFAKELVLNHHDILTVEEREEIAQFFGIAQVANPISPAPAPPEATEAAPVPAQAPDVQAALDVIGQAVKSGGNAADIERIDGELADLHEKAGQLDADREIVADALADLRDNKVQEAWNKAEDARIEAEMAKNAAGDAVATAESAKDSVADFNGRVDEILDALNNAPPAVKRRVATAGGNNGTHWMEKLLWEFCAPGAASKPLHFAGEAGMSKTYFATRFASNFDYHVVSSGHGGKDRLALTGWTVPMPGTSDFVYKDGEWTTAFRSVAIDPVTGDPLPGTVDSCLLIADELNRLPLEMKSVAIPALNTRIHPATGEECYVLETGRVTVPQPGDPGVPAFAAAAGVAVPEYLWAPVAKLAIVATSNEGVGFDIPDEDMAEDERFVKIRVTYDADEAETIFANVAQNSGFAHATGVAQELRKFVNTIRDGFLVRGCLIKGLSVRLVCRSLEHANGDTAILRERLEADLRNHCASLTGKNQIDESASAFIDEALRDLSF